MPVFADCSHEAVVVPRWNVVNGTQRKAVADVAGGTALSVEGAIVLRDRRLEHGRAKIGRIAQIFRPRVVCKKSKSAGITTADVHVARVVPALRAVLQQVDGADGEADLTARASARRGSVGDTRRQHRICDEADFGKGTPWAYRSRPRRR